MDAWTIVDDVGQAIEATRGKTLANIVEWGTPKTSIVSFEFTDGTTIQVISPDLMILEVGYAQKPR